MTEADGSERAGPSTQLGAAWSTLAAITMIKIGHNASTRALTPMPMTAEWLRVFPSERHRATRRQGFVRLG
jgi:hypothetical protein